MISVADILKKFDIDLKLIDGHKNINNLITKPGFNRLGFELCGIFVDKKIKNVIVFGNREFTYLMNLSKKERNLRLLGILKLQPPMILLTKSFDDITDLLEINKKYQVPIIQSNMFSNDISLSIGTLISQRLATYETIHAVLLEIYGEGVLITGRSGIGKSEIAMEMIKKNHLFIADDAVDIARIGGGLLGKSNEIAKDFIEVRGLGILNIAKMFGIEKIKSSTYVSVVIELIPVDDLNEHFERIGSKQKSQIYCGVRIPKYVLPISSGRKLSDLIESVVIDLKLKREGYNAATNFIKRYRKIQNMNSINFKQKNKTGSN